MSELMLFRPHALGNIMADPASMDVTLLSPDELAIWRKRGRTAEESAYMDECRARGLSEGAKTYLAMMAKQILFGVQRQLDSKEMRKGLAVEEEAIHLYNNVFFAQHKKNTERRTTDLLSGECDIHEAGRCTVDIKSAWSIETFPLLPEDCHSAIYEWQGRAYMHLWDVPKHTVAYCLVSTPDDLIPRGEQMAMHKVDHIDPKLRVTRLTYERDMALEAKMLAKCRVAQKYLAELLARVRAEHKVVADWKQKFQK